jgi:hypothetical protein
MKKIFIGCFALLSLFSCENYLDVNEDQQNRPDFDKISPAQMFAGAVNGYTNHQVITLNDFGNKMAYAWGLNSGFTTNDAAYNYNFTSSDYGGNFSTSALVADNFQDILDKQAIFPDYSYHFGAAKVFKVMCMDYVTALYGDAPYTEAFDKDQDNLTPAYDDDVTIIPKLLVELDEAREFFNNPSSNVIPFEAEDIVFNGDLAKWSQFINTVELRLLLRLSKTSNASLVALRTARFANLPNNFITSNVQVNPGYNLSNFAQRSPVYRVYGLNEALNDWSSANRSNAAGDFIAKVLNGTQNTATLDASGVVDPRRARLFTLVSGNVLGNVQGDFPLTAISRVSSFYFGRIGTKVDDNGAGKNANLMLAAESYFLQAEAIQRGYMTGNAETSFNAGITASFNFYSTGWGDYVPTVLNPATYLAAISAKNGLGWAGSADKINCIITQKYLALANWSGVELFIDHLRTGYPALPLPLGVTETNRPYRLIYPTSEYSSNSANVPFVSNAELFSINAKTPYYLQ